ncbi:hypothetical protein CH341_10095 [Rhodoplanes roseus]|uniref:Uncharacterized protein n=1 Tax=Rhodoplanes roseus TaxID=29409 RepID=A0A327L1C1_9BRAD|nr:hypothetical protein CH341_10095 [Rhodoplanes roseus]
MGCLAAWVLAANTVLKDPSAPRRDVAAALLAARDGAPPTLSILKIASSTPSPDLPPPAAAEPAAPVAPIAIAEAPAAEPPALAADPEPTLVLASAGPSDVTGTLSAAPLPAGMPDGVEDPADAPLAELVPLPRKRPLVALVPLPRPRPEVEAVASAAPATTIPDWQIERNQPQ